MKHRTTCVCTLVALAAACATETYKQPPAGSYTAATYQVRIGETVTPLQGASVTRDFFGGPVFLGRAFIEADFAPSAVPVVVLNGDFWKERFGGEPSIIGRPLEIDGGRATVVGVAPPGFTVPDGARLWVPKRQ